MKSKISIPGTDIENNKIGNKRKEGENKGESNSWGCLPCCWFTSNKTE